MGVGRLDGESSYVSEPMRKDQDRKSENQKDERTPQGSVPWETIGLLNARWR